jgi:hypothetical protein
MSKRVLTRSEEYGICVYYVCGVTIRRIMEHFGIGRSAIHRVLVRNGINTDRGKASQIKAES